MVDRYIFGKVERISPEAPVPVNKVDHMTSVLGGAANVASNLANLDCHVLLGGLIGDDENADLLHDLLTESHIDGSGLVVRKDHATTTKMRILGSRQQMVRLDFEEVTPLAEKEEEILLNWLHQQLATGLDGIILSDYQKGVLTDSLSKKVIEAANNAHIPILVDPKGSDWSKYNGADFVTPNMKELGDCLGRSVANEGQAVVEAASSLYKQYSFAHLMVTRSEKGITVVGKDGKVWNNPATAQEVFDVSGAGDTVAAAFLAAVAGKLSIRTSLQIANAAAGIVVTKVGTIHSSPRAPEIMGRLASRSLAALSVPYLGGNGPKDTGLAAERGNRRLYERLFRHSAPRSRPLPAAGSHAGPASLVGLNSDDSVRRLKGETRPLVAQEDRAVLLGALGCIDDVVIFEEDTPKELLEVLRPDILVKGGDYKADEVIGRESVKRVEIISFEEGYSTTGLVQK